MPVSQSPHQRNGEAGSDGSDGGGAGGVEPLGLGAEPVPSYLAYVVRTDTTAVELVDLGKASEIDALVEELRSEVADLAVGLAEKGCENVNFVSPTHVAHAVAEAIWFRASAPVRFAVAPSTKPSKVPRIAPTPWLSRIQT